MGPSNKVQIKSQTFPKFRDVWIQSSGSGLSQIPICFNFHFSYLMWFSTVFSYVVPSRWLIPVCLLNGFLWNSAMPFYSTQWDLLTFSKFLLSYTVQIQNHDFVIPAHCKEKLHSNCCRLFSMQDLMGSLHPCPTIPLCWTCWCKRR